MIVKAMPTLSDYTIVIRPDEDTFVAYVPAISGCHAMGATREEALSEIVGVFKMVAEHARNWQAAAPRHRNPYSLAIGAIGKT
jgi:predicted RNase H-like HicB family nuclease